METIKTYFAARKEQIPTWLAAYKRNSQLDYKEILSNRLIYYSGSALDGEVIKTFNLAHAAHTYIYVDYMLDKTHVINHIRGRGLLGYKLFHLREFALSEVSVSNEQLTTIKETERKRSELTNDLSFSEFGLLAVFDRRAEFNETHGAKRIALIYLSTDAITAYLKLFNQERPPFINVLQDHSMGGNYTTFGRHGLLDRISLKHNINAPYLYVASNTRPWGNYIRLRISPTKVYYRFRYLFKRRSE